MDNINDALVEIKKLNKIFISLLLNEVKKVFDECPNIAKISWNQYIPTFNDGEPCLFTTSEIYYLPFNKDNEVENKDYEDEDDEEVSNLESLSYNLLTENKDYQNKVQPLERLFNKIPDYVLMGEFDIYVSVYIDRDLTVTTTEYYYDY